MLSIVSLNEDKSEKSCEFIRFRHMRLIHATYVLSKNKLLTTFVLLISPNCKVTSLSSFDDVQPFRQPKISNDMSKHLIR